MDWKSLLEKTKTITEKSKPLIEKAKVYSSSAIAFVWKQVEQTPIFIKTEEEYNIHASEKRSICIAYDASNTISEPIRIMMPVWATQAWTDTAVLKYIEISWSKDLSSTLQISWPLEMRVSYMGEEQCRLNSLEEIKSWWKERNYTKEEGVSDTSEITMKENELALDPIEALDAKPQKTRKKKTEIAQEE